MDYRLALHVRGEEVLASSSDPENPDYYGPRLAVRRNAAQPAPSFPPRLFGGGGASFDLMHVGIDRDVYYYTPGNTRALSLPWAPRGGWASPQSPILLRDHEHFMLGDNTAASKDSRLWDEVGSHLVGRGEDVQLGTVPRDQDDWKGVLRVLAKPDTSSVAGLASRHHRPGRSRRRPDALDSLTFHWSALPISASCSPRVFPNSTSESSGLQSFTAYDQALLFHRLSTIQGILRRALRNQLLQFQQHT